MNLEKRLQQLENKIGVNDEPLPLILIAVQDKRRGSTDPGVLQMGIIPGRSDGPPGFTLNRGENEDPDDFLSRAQEVHERHYLL
jgi:hypothetical protein